jgi:hypothetical protein
MTIAIIVFCGCVVAKKMKTTNMTFFVSLLEKKKKTMAMAIVFFSTGFVAKKATTISCHLSFSLYLRRRQQHIVVVIFFCQKKMTVMCHRLFMWVFWCEEGNGSYRCLLFLST